MLMYVQMGCVLTYSPVNVNVQGNNLPFYLKVATLLRWQAVRTLTNAASLLSFLD